jgi:hypothetical protein
LTQMALNGHSLLITATGKAKPIAKHSKSARYEIQSKLTSLYFANSVIFN